MKKIALISILPMAVSWADAAAAACDRNDASGAWDIYSVSFADAPYWSRCVVRISGTSVAGGSCRDSAGDRSAVAAGTGAVAVATSCRMVISFTQQFDTGDVAGRIDATLARDKSTLAGVGAADGGQIFVINGVRR
jgi:hypothetical protein